LSGGRRIVLHAGLHKTGTSTIQNVLHANRGFLLEREGALYPNLSNALGAVFRDDPRKRRARKRMAGFTDEEIGARREKLLDALDAEISSMEWSTLLLSAEGASHLSAPELAKLRKWGEGYATEWTVLVCVRHPFDWTRSVVQQRLKGGETLREMYGDIPAPNYRARISRAITVFGRGKVRIFNFESAAKGEGGVVGAFARGWAGRRLSGVFGLALCARQRVALVGGRADPRFVEPTASDLRRRRQGNPPRRA
jgi:hypothetical protein